MRKGSRIINISFASAFQPNSYINLYAASKAFERSYSRALNVNGKKLKMPACACEIVAATLGYENTDGGDR